MFFEGAEKRVELRIDPTLPSLRERGARCWSDVVGVCGVQVLSCLSNRCCDAYLLSESSLFVFDHQVVLITCGRTKLTAAVLEILDQLPEEAVEMLIYERKNEMFPHDQSSSFLDDARVLNERVAGRAFLFGDEDAHHLHLFHLDREDAPDVEEAAIEILLYGLEPGVRGVFCRAEQHDESFRGACAALREILPGYDVDDHVFDPAGYSLNGILDDRYFTVHVTPQPVGSYVGFETNHCFVDAEELDACIGRLLEMFRPRSVDVVAFDLGLDVDLAQHGLDVKRRIHERLPCGYEVSFLSSHRRRSDVTRTMDPRLPAGRRGASCDRAST